MLAVDAGLSATTLGGLSLIIGAMGLFLWRVLRTFLTAIESQRQQYILDQQKQRDLAWGAVRDNQQGLEDALREHRMETNAWLNNHLSGYTRELGNLTEAVKKLTEEIHRGR